MSDQLQEAIESFIDRYEKPSTKELYSIDLRLFVEWCESERIDPLKISRSQLEGFSRYLSLVRKNSQSTIAHRLGVIRFFYEVCADDGLILRNPARLVRIPSVNYDSSKMLGLDRRELGALITVAKRDSSTKWALASLMGLMGLRVSEACSIRIDSYLHRLERGHQVLVFMGKGDKPATAPIPVLVLRALEECRGSRTNGPLLRRSDGEQLDRRTAGRWINSLGIKAGIDKRVTPHTLRRTYVTLSLDAGVSPRDVQQGARHAKLDTTMRYDVARQALDRHNNHALASFVAGAM